MGLCADTGESWGAARGRCCLSVQAMAFKARLRTEKLLHIDLADLQSGL